MKPIPLPAWITIIGATVIAILIIAINGGFVEKKKPHQETVPVLYKAITIDTNEWPLSCSTIDSMDWRGRTLVDPNFPDSINQIK